MAVHRTVWKIVRAVDHLLHGVVERRAIGLMRQVVSEAHNDVLGVIPKDMLASMNMGGHELRKVADVLVLGLLGGAGMDTGCGASRTRTTSVSGEDGL